MSCTEYHDHNLDAMPTRADAAYAEREALRAAVRDLADAAQGARITLAWAHGNNYLPMAESPTATSRWDEAQLAAALDRHASTIQACRENQ